MTVILLPITVSVSADSNLPRFAKPGSMTTAMMATPTHGSAPTFFEAL